MNVQFIFHCEKHRFIISGSPQLLNPQQLNPLFSLFKKKPAPSIDFSFLGVDMHSHILPGIDDGAPDLETSMVLIRGLQVMGYSQLIATPHIYKELYPNTIETIQQALAIVQSEVKNQGLNIQVEAAAEYFLDDHFESLLAQDQLLTMPDRHILIEMSFLAPYPKLHEIIFQLRTKGYQPILAHPERYVYYADKLGEFEKIRSFGCKMQVNLLSLSGYYGKVVQKLSRQLLDRQWVDFLGTDLHHKRHEEHLKSSLKDHRLMEQIQSIGFQNSCWNNESENNG